MMRAWIMAITERVHHAIGKYLNDALDQIHLAEMSNVDDGTQEPGICPVWYPETSSIDNGWPSTSSIERA